MNSRQLYTAYILMPNAMVVHHLAVMLRNNNILAVVEAIGTEQIGCLKGITALSAVQSFP